jgi:hypothetical protein
MTTPKRTRPTTRASSVLRTIRVLAACYAALSALTLVAAFLMAANPVLVPDSVWVRGVIVLVSSLLLNAFAARAARGSRGAWRRVWLFSAVMAVAIVVIIAIPGVFPAWMKVEQGVCGALLVAVVVLARGRVLRAAFAAPAQS